MKIKDLKLMLFVDEKKEVVIKSADFYENHDIIYIDWLSFVDDESIDDLILDNYGFSVIIGPNTIVLWVVLR